MVEFPGSYESVMALARLRLRTLDCINQQVAV